MRNWSNDKAFQIGVHTLRGNLSPVEAGTALSNLAEASISVVLSAAADEFAGRLAPGRDGGVAAAVLGDPASGEAAPGAALDILFVYEGGSDDSYDGLCWRFHDALRDLSRDSLIFAPIAGGRKGRAVRSLAEFAEHCRSAASANELLDLTRARCVFEHGAAGVGARFEAARREAVAVAGGASRDALIAELREAGDGAAEAGLSAYRDMRGGFRAIERAARLLQVVHAEDAPGAPAPTAASVFRHAAAQGWIADGAAAELTEAAMLWRTLHGALRLVADEDASVEALGSGVKAVLARSSGMDDFDALTAAVGETAARAASEIAALEGTAHGAPTAADSVTAGPA